jgi:hypothetical protein
MNSKPTPSSNSPFKTMRGRRERRKAEKEKATAEVGGGVGVAWFR